VPGARRLLLVPAGAPGARGAHVADGTPVPAAAPAPGPAPPGTDGRVGAAPADDEGIPR
jgi:hypothetical protein